MIRTARSKIVSKVTKIEVTDEFVYAKWLRKPRIITPDVRVIDSSELIDGFEVEKLNEPNSLKLKFKLNAIDIPRIRQKYKIEKPHAYLIFFGLTRPQLFALKEDLNFQPQVFNLNSELPQIPEIVDQSSVFIAQPAKTIDQSEDFISKPSETIDQSSILNFEAVPTTCSKEIYFNDISISEIPLLINPPQITDQLADLVPEIYDIELLNVEKFDQARIKSETYDFNNFIQPEVFKIDVPGIDDLLNSTTTSHYVPFEDIPQAEVKFYSPSFEIQNPIFKVKINLPKTIVKKVVVKQKNLEPIVIDALNDDIISDSLKNELKTLLSSFRELSWEEYSINLIGLDNYELESGEFLSSNNFAMLTDELGYDKFDQTSAALSFLHKKGNVKSVLLITDVNRFSDYWTPSFKSYAKEIKVKEIEPSSAKKVKGSSVIWFLDANNIGKIESSELNKFDLVLIDELVNIKSAASQIDQIINQIEPNYIWFLTAIANTKYNKKFLENFQFTQKVSFNFFGKSLSDIQGDEPKSIIKNIWLELDEMQLFEYQETISQVKEELAVLFDSPNPLRFQTNIFTMIHKLKQILNFSAFRNISPKANLFIEQAEAIYRNKKKAIIFTQYDENGMKKIEKTLEINNIRFIAGRNGMSIDELKESLDTFYTKRGVTVFLTNLKPSRIKIDLNKVPYIINFDQWWNPVTNWQNEEDLGMNEIVQTPVIVYNYQMKNTFEDELQRVLADKGFNSSYLFDNLKSETVSELITPEDWLSIFGMNDNYNKNLNNERTKLINKLQTIDLNSFKGIIKYFFSFLGYRDISVMDIDDEPMFYIIGTAKKGTTPVNLHGKCLLTTNLKKEDYEEVIHFKPAANEIKRKFVITNGEFAERFSNGTMYIDGKDLANYIITLGLKAQVKKK